LPRSSDSRRRARASSCARCAASAETPLQRCLHHAGTVYAGRRPSSAHSFRPRRAHSVPYRTDNDGWQRRDPHDRAPAQTKYDQFRRPVAAQGKRDRRSRDRERFAGELCTGEGFPSRPSEPAEPSAEPVRAGALPAVLRSRAHSVPVRTDNHGQQRCDQARATTPSRRIHAGQQSRGRPSAIASQAESASSILVTRSRLKPQAGGLGFMYCWRISSRFRPVEHAEIGHAKARALDRCHAGTAHGCQIAPLACDFVAHTGSVHGPEPSACCSLGEAG